MLQRSDVTMSTITTKLRRQRMTLVTFMARPQCEGRIEELLDGELVVSPTARWRHNEIALLLATQLTASLQAGRLGGVSGPQTVVLAAHQAPAPDLCVILTGRLHIIRDGYPHGAPDLAIEILSPSNRSNDLIRKKRIYAEHGVREYWIIDGDAETVTRYWLHRGRYHKGEVRRRSIRLRILPQVRVDLSAIWRAVRPAE
jgi:Uma2 family endonuclease